MKKFFACAITTIVLLFMVTPIFAQEWSKEQTELWKVLQERYTKWQNGDFDGFTALVHDQYQGWSNNDPLPLGKEMLVSRFKDLIKSMKLESNMMNPARIVITKNAAVVDFYFALTFVSTAKDKQNKMELNGKNVEFFVKENGKWLLLGDMTEFKMSKSGDN